MYIPVKQGRVLYDQGLEPPSHGWNHVDASQLLH